MSTFNRFSDTARAILHFAREEAQTLGFSRIEPDHLWLGLLHASDRSLAEMLLKLDMDVSILYEDLRARLAQKEKASAEGEIVLSRRSKVVVGRAARLTSSPLGSIINPEHLLLALWYEEQCLGARLLRKSGITLERLQGQLGLASFDLASLHLETQEVPPVRPDAATRRRMRRLDCARLYYIPCAWLICVVAFLLLLIHYCISYGDLIAHSLLMLFAAAPFLLAQPRPEWFPWLALGIGLIGYGLRYLLRLPLRWIYAVWLPRLYKKTGWKTLCSSSLRWFIAYSLDHASSLCQFLMSLEVVYALFILLPTAWWLASTLYFGLLYLARAYILTMLNISLFTRVIPVPQGPLTACLELLLQRTGTHVDGLYMKELKGAKPTGATLVPNAYLTHWGHQTRIVLTDTLYHKFPLDEQEVLLAHELGHLVHHDALRNVGWRTLFIGLWLFACQQLLFASGSPTMRVHSFVLSFTSRTVMLLLLCYTIFIGFFLLRRWLRRGNEYRADEYALQVTQKGDAFKRLMQRREHYSVLPMSDTRWQLLVSTHPILRQRLEHANAFVQHQAGNISRLSQVDV